LLSLIAYWIAFGPHGPRAQTPKGEGWKILFKVTQLTLVSFALFYAIHLFAKPQPKTMSKEWQEASNEYALVCIELLFAVIGSYDRDLISHADRALTFASFFPVREHEPHPRYQQARLRGQGLRPEPPCREVINRLIA